MHRRQGPEEQYANQDSNQESGGGRQRSPQHASVIEGPRGAGADVRVFQDRREYQQDRAVEESLAAYSNRSAASSESRTALAQEKARAARVATTAKAAFVMVV